MSIAFMHCMNQKQIWPLSNYILFFNKMETSEITDQWSAALPICGIGYCTWLQLPGSGFKFYFTK